MSETDLTPEINGLKLKHIDEFWPDKFSHVELFRVGESLKSFKESELSNIFLKEKCELLITIFRQNSELELDIISPLLSQEDVKKLKEKGGKNHKEILSMLFHGLTKQEILSVPIKLRLSLINQIWRPGIDIALEIFPDIQEACVYDKIYLGRIIETSEQIKLLEKAFSIDELKNLSQDEVNYFNSDLNISVQELLDSQVSKNNNSTNDINNSNKNKKDEEKENQTKQNHDNYGAK